MIAKKLKQFFPQIILAALIAIYFIATPKTEKVLETALLNPKYNPDKITLSYKKEGSATFAKTGSFWICDYVSPDGTNAVFPCDNKIIANLLENARKIIKVYEISDDLASKDNFSLSQDKAFCIEFSQEGKAVSKLYFGAADSRKRIAFYSDTQSQKKAKIYSTNSPILNYLNTSPDFWCDPYIFPQSVCGDTSGAVATKIDAFETRKGIDAAEVARLRHGKIVLGKASQSQKIAELQNIAKAITLKDADSENISVVEIDDGKGNFYKTFFTPVGDEERNYYCRFIATPSAARSAEEKIAIEKLDYVTTISTWTFNQLIIAGCNQ